MPAFETQRDGQRDHERDHERDPQRSPSPTSVAPATGPARTADDPSRWHELVAEMGAEIAAPLTAALERVNTLVATGRIDREGLRALRDEIEQARQVGIIGQQLTRFASGRLRQSRERLQLHEMLEGLAAHRTREAQARGIELRCVTQPAEVMADASLLFNLLNATFDWALPNAGSPLDIALEVRNGPVATRLTCRFPPHAGHAADVPARAPDTLAWRLLEQTAWAMGLTVVRRDGAASTTLQLEFPRAAGSALDGVSAVEIDEGFAPSANSQPLAGTHVLVIASRRDMRVQIRDTLRNMSLIIDFVNSVEEATAFCREGLPHAVIIESIQNGARFAAFREEIVAEVPGFVFIEIVEEGRAFEMSGFGRSDIAHVGRDVLASSLPSALIFELSKSL